MGKCWVCGGWLGGAIACAWAGWVGFWVKGSVGACTARASEGGGVYAVGPQHEGFPLPFSSSKCLYLALVPTQHTQTFGQLREGVRGGVGFKRGGWVTSILTAWGAEVGGRVWQGQLLGGGPTGTKTGRCSSYPCRVAGGVLGVTGLGLFHGCFAEGVRRGGIFGCVPL